MAVPDTFTTRDISGKFQMNKTLSDDTDQILSLQGVSWFLRKAIKAATITLFIKHYIDDNGAEHIDIDQTLTGGIGGSTETRVLDWQEREHNDRIFGPVVGKARRIDLDEVMEEYLRDGWTDDTEEHGVIDAYARSNTSKSGKTWTSEQTWGLEVIGGVKRYARHVVFVGGKGEKINARLVYDYQGPV